MRLIKQTYTMEPHDLSPGGPRPELTLELIDTDSGEYVVMTARDWEFHVGAKGYIDIDNLAETIRAMLNGPVA